MNYTFFCYWYFVKFLETLPRCQGHLCDKGLLSKWHHTPYRDVRPVQGLWLSQLTGSFSSSVVTFHWPFQSATLKRLLRMWECEQSEQVANTQILRPNVCLLPARRVCRDTVPGVCVIGQRSKLTLRDVRPWILTHTWILKYLLNVITGLSDVSGDVIFICFLFSLQLLTAVHPFLSNHCFTVFLQLSVSLSPHIQLPPAFSHFPPPLHSCLFPHISFQPGSTQVQKHNPRFSACRWIAFPPRVSAKFSTSFTVLPSYFCASLACFALNGSRFGSFPLAVAVSIWWAVGRKVEAPSRSSFLLSLQIATKA